MKVDLPSKLKKEMSGTVKDYGYESTKEFVKDSVERRLLALEKEQFLKGVQKIKDKMQQKGLSEKEMLEDFEKFRQNQ